MYLQPVTHLELKQGSHVETSENVPMTIGVRMKTFIDGADGGAADEDPVMFTDCADVPYKVVLSDNKNFELKEKAGEELLSQTKTHKKCSRAGSSFGQQMSCNLAKLGPPCCLLDV